ncbi:ABC transporter ATP-binding protein [Methanoplanus limicola]|uniref:ABC transporter related protein n=1 Tax=Methanoplanus limicola DSM 2279 TaxID=937775 RepID=H1Z066_9EURY|nr:ABC transporter ATP-binding protein [Methanoplanus limicola]EHQ36158.1 ABC transporter related protein [Methanoplanus limicola DSM 2279]
MIEFKNLTKTYNGINAVDNLSLTIENGEIFGLLGPNGAGKSTTILMLCGLIQPTSGECLIDGTEVSKNPVEVKRNIGYMPEDVGFYQNLTAEQNLSFFAKLYDMNKELRDKKIPELLELVGLEGVEKTVGGYSKGMRQRLGIAKALINDPSVVILDEPTANLDPQGVSDYRKIIRQISDSEKTVLVSSHILSEVSKVCSDVGIMQKGRLVHRGSWQELSGSLNICGLESIIINLEAESEIPELAISDITGTEISADGRRAVITAKSDVRSEISRVLNRNNVLIKELCIDQTTLEDAVLSYYNLEAAN